MRSEVSTGFLWLVVCCEIWNLFDVIVNVYSAWLKLWIWRSSHDTWRYISSIHWTHSSIATASTTLYAQEFSPRQELLVTWWFLCWASLCLCLVDLLAQGEAKLKWSLSSTDLNADAMSVFLISYVSWLLVLMVIRVWTQSDRQESFNHMSLSWCMCDCCTFHFTRSFEGKRMTICWCGLHWFCKKLMLTFLSACCD